VGLSCHRAKTAKGRFVGGTISRCSAAAAYSITAPGLPPGKFGTSFGTHAVVLNRQVEKTAADKGFSKALILGYVMAHELGHLLLGNNSHGQGVMMGTFGRREFERAEKGELVFTPEQAKQMLVRILKSY
jgi:hypothetical protein